MKRTGMALAALLLLPALPVRAAEGAERPVVNGPLTREEAVRIALLESPVVRGAVAEVEAAAARVAAARAERRPMVSANAFLTGGSNGGIYGSPTAGVAPVLMAVPRDAFADLNLTVMLPLLEGGRLRAAARAAAARRAAGEADLEAARQDVALWTRTAYNTVLARREMMSVWRAKQNEDAERLRLDRLRLEQEQIPAYYVRRDEAEAAASLQELTNAERDAEIAMIQLKTVMGIAQESAPEIGGPLPTPSMAALRAAVERNSREVGMPEWGDDGPPVDALLRQARAARPELAAARQRERGAQSDAEAARGTFRPQVDAMAMGDWMNMEGEGTNAGVGVGLTASLPLATGGLRKARVAEADAVRRREEQQRARLALQVEEEVRTALLNLNAARRNLDAAQAGLTAAEAENEAANLRYQVGRSIQLEALEALAGRARAAGNLVQARYAYAVAYDQLLRAIGAADAPHAAQ